MDSRLKFAFIELKRTPFILNLSELKRIYVEEWIALPDKTKALEEVIAKYKKELFSNDEEVDIMVTSFQENQDNPPQP